jgi:hypothetical protein
MTRFCTRIESTNDERSHVAATEIETDCRSRDRAASLAPRRRSDRCSGALDQ